jgi:putative ABC transport system permease protein
LVGDLDVGRSNDGDTIDNLPSRHGSVTRTDWTSRLPAGSRITPDAWVRYARLSVGSRAEVVEGVALDLRDPLTQGIYRLRAGRAPAGSSEVAVTTGLAKALHVHIGDSLDFDSRRLRVVAIVENPDSLGERSVVAPADALGGLTGHARSNPTAPVGGDWYSNVGYWLVDTPGAAPDLHERLLHDGVVFETRNQWEHPAPELISTSQVDGQVLIVLGTVAGFGLLEVVLLAGAAFAVGARRQTHELGLLAATGGDDTDVRRTVLGQGAVLGVLGGVVGVGTGVLAVTLLRGVLEQASDRRFGALDVVATDLVAVVVLGIVAGLLAAIVPARAAAARSVLHMLRERFDADGRRVRLPRWAAIALVVGVALTVLAAVRWHAGTGDLQSEFVNTGSVSAVMHGLISMLRENWWPAVMWFGAVLTLAGLVRACPALVSRLATLSRPLPVSPRLALRDAGRHRHRTAPAVAAVMTVVAGAVLVLFVASSSDLRDKHMFQPVVPIGVISVGTDGTNGLSGPTLPQVAAQTAALVGGGQDQLIEQATEHGEVTVQAPGCRGRAAGDLAACQFFGVGVASPGAIDLIAGRPVPAAARVLADGRAVVFDPALVQNGTVAVHIGQGGPRASTEHVAATVVRGVPSYGGLPQIFVSPGTATAHGWRSRNLLALVRPTHAPSSAVIDRAENSIGDGAFIFLQQRYHSRYSPVLLAMLGAAAIATLAGTSIAVALAMAESRADMATMAAVGASPGRRRTYAMGQAAIVAGLGTGLGLALGALVALATLGGSERYPTSAPFRWLAAVLLVAPALAIGVAGLVTRSRVTLTRRIA